MPSMEKVLADGPTSVGLGPESEAVLKDMTDEILQETMTDFDTHRDKHDRRVDTEYWKPVQRVDHWQMFQDRRNIRETPRMLKTPRGGYTVTDPNQSVPKFLLVGKVPGTVGDFQLGDLSATASDWKARSMYVGDNLVNIRYLCTLEEPTAENPYQSCAIVWIAMGSSIIPFVDTRDILMIFRKGMTEGKDGEQIGYFIAHSVDIRETLANNGVVRAKGSFCYLRRQMDDNFVELYHTGFMATMGSIPELASTKAVSMFLATSVQVGEAGVSRKLRSMMQRSFKNRSTLSQTSASDCAGGCGSGKSLISHGVCVICQQRLCSHCKTRRRIIINLDRDVLKAKTFAFCKGCILTARRTDTEECIRADLESSIADSPYLDVDSLTIASTSESDMTTKSANSTLDLSYVGPSSTPTSERSAS